VQLDLGQPEVDFDSNILDVDIPKELEKSIRTNYKPIDTLFAGDGIVPSTTAAITGAPGVGKTTIMLQTADSITSMGHIALYNTGEENLYQIRRHTKRLELKNGFVPGYNLCVDDIIEHLEMLQVANPNKQLFLIQDSIQCLLPSRFDSETGEPRKGRSKNNLNAQLDAIVSLATFAKNNFVSMLLINQITKDGKMAGLKAIEHLVDAHLHLGFDDNKKSETYGKRFIEMKKNRFGVAGLSIEFELVSNGVNFAMPEPAIHEEPNLPIELGFTASDLAELETFARKYG